MIHSPRSFILIELLLATMLVGVGLAGIMMTFSSSVKAHTTQERRSMALLITEREFDRLAQGPVLASAGSEARESIDPEGYRIETKAEPIGTGSVVRVELTVTRGDDSLSMVRYFEQGGERLP